MIYTTRSEAKAHLFAAKFLADHAFDVEPTDAILWVTFDTCPHPPTALLYPLIRRYVLEARESRETAG